MVFGSFVADSLAMGIHWIYDTDLLAQQVGRITDLLAPSEKGYHSNKKRGDLTHYGDQSLLLLRHLVSRGGHFSLADYAKEWQRYITGYSGYVDRAMRTSLQNLLDGSPPETCGSPSTDLGGAARIAPLIYCYRNDLQGLLDSVHEQTSFTHRGPGAVEGATFLARSCHAILHGTPPRQAFREALESGVGDIDLDLRLRRCLDLPKGSISGTVKDFGQMCAISAALPAAVYTVLQSENTFEEALIETAMAGGDSAARGMVVGMILGASLGMDAIPVRWLNQLLAFQELQSALDELP